LDLIGACPNTLVGAVQLTDDELFDPYEQALLWAESDVGIVVTPDEQMHLLAISDRVVTDSVGHSVDTDGWCRRGVLVRRNRSKRCAQ
jgi:hypothetical protein